MFQIKSQQGSEGIMLFELLGVIHTFKNKNKQKKQNSKEEDNVNTQCE